MEWARDPNLYPPYLRSRIRRGLGVGRGISYKPWRDIGNTGTKGTAGCVHGIRVDRRYEILDERARAYFYLLERREEISDVQEKWPILDIDRTLQLAGEFDVDHPLHEIFPEPICVDFLIKEGSTPGSGYRAAALAGSVNTISERNQRLLLIQQRWCQEHSIDWTLVDTSRLNKTVLDSLHFVRSWYRHRLDPDTKIADSFAKCFLDTYERNVVLDRLVETSRKRLRLASETALDLFRYCAWSRRIPVSLEHRIAKNCPVTLQRDCDA
jgi:hypothetical protein